MKKLIAVTAIALALSGCSVGVSKWDEKALVHTNLAFIGVPGPLGIGFTGTTTPVSATTSLTNSHVAYPMLKRIIKDHPVCDLALIKQDNAGELLPKGIAPAWPGLKVTLYGYSGRTLLPVSGSGTIKGLEMRDGCQVAWTDAGSVQGMSGGAVVNSAGYLVGIIYGADLVNGRTYFVPSQSFKPLFD